LSEIASISVDWAALPTEIPEIVDFWEELYGPDE
jgi:hypothetical protein